MCDEHNVGIIVQTENSSFVLINFLEMTGCCPLVLCCVHFCL